MFIRVKSTPNSPRKSIQIVEGYRDANNKVKQRILKHLGVFENAQEEAAIRACAQEIMLQIKADRDKSSPQGALFEALPHTSPKKPGRPKKKALADILPPAQVSLDDVEEVDRIMEGIHDVGGAMYETLGFDALLTKKRPRSILKDIVLSRMAPQKQTGLATPPQPRLWRGLPSGRHLPHDGSAPRPNSPDEGDLLQQHQTLDAESGDKPPLF